MAAKHPPKTPASRKVEPDRLVERLKLPAELSPGMLELLLKEKEHVDAQISRNLQANVQIMGAVVAALVAGLGWTFSKSGPLEAEQAKAVMLALVTLTSFGAFIGGTFNGFAFGYIAYKTCYLGPLFQKLLRLQFNPQLTSAYVGTTPAQWAILFSTAASGGAQTLLSWGLFLWAYSWPPDNPAGTASFGVPTGAFWAVGVILLLATGCSILTVWSMYRTRAMNAKEAAKSWPEG